MINFKVGDKVWVLCNVVGDGNASSVLVEHCLAEFYACVTDCEPAESDNEKAETVSVKTICVGDIENKIATASEINEKTKQCIVNYIVNEINARVEKGYSNWWTRELHIVESKHINAVLESFEEKGYKVELYADKVWIGW